VHEPRDYDRHGRSDCCAKRVCDRRKILFLPRPEFHANMIFPANRVWQDWFDRLRQALAMPAKIAQISLQFRFWGLSQRRFDKPNACRPRQARSLSSDQCGGLPRKREPVPPRRWYHKIRRTRSGRDLPIADIVGDENEDVCEQLWRNARLHSTSAPDSRRSAPAASRLG
jgi:hypothetical protein